MLEPATLAWLERHLAPGEAVADARPLRGGWTSRICAVRTTDDRDLVLRSFLTPFFRRHAPGLLTREAEVLALLRDTDVPAAEPLAVDPTGEHCAVPSLLMTRLPGAVRLTEDTGAALATLLVRVHTIAPADRPRRYQPWTAPDRVAVPSDTDRPTLWVNAVDAIRREPPPFTGRFLHRDFHPGNVLFAGGDITGVVDWVETSWGPADLDVAHCATALALLHGPDAGLRLADHYTAAGGELSADPRDHLYWRLLDTLAFAPDAEKVAGPWRDLGRTDLTPALLRTRLEDYLAALVERYS
ncbi:phosphotransferase family protein [Streptomyces sp. NPDC127098]|uniref:phosphotransferase family protein n=1 Tax=Streptomyces sp. NPDC127098 TaxID=3347137 RepID=UPI00364AAC8F